MGLYLSLSLLLSRHVFKTHIFVLFGKESRAGSQICHHSMDIHVHFVWFNSLLTQTDLLIDCFVYRFQAQTNTYPHVSKQCLDEGGYRRLLPLPPPPPRYSFLRPSLLLKLLQYGYGLRDLRIRNNCVHLVTFFKQNEAFLRPLGQVLIPYWKYFRFTT